MNKPTKPASRRTLHYAWVILLAMCVIRSLSAAGINNTGGLFLNPVSTDLGVGVGNLSIYFSISSVATMLTLPLAGKLIERFGIRAMILSAAALQTLSFMSLGLMNSVWGWYVMSIPMGVGGAILVNLAGPLLVNRWFKDNSGTALGIMMACVGIFGAVIQPLVISTIAGMGWRKTYFFLGAAVAVIILLVAVLFIRNSPEKKGLQPYTSGKAVKQKAERAAAVSIPKSRALKSFAFGLLLIFMVAITAFGAFSQHLATYGYSLGYGETQMSTALSISMLGSTVGAILIGYVSDKLGVFRATIGVLVAATVALACLLFGGGGTVIFTLGGFLLGLAATGIPVLAPLLTRAYFGGGDYGEYLRRHYDGSTLCQRAATASVRLFVRPYGWLSVGACHFGRLFAHWYPLHTLGLAGKEQAGGSGSAIRCSFVDRVLTITDNTFVLGTQFL